MNAWKNHLFPQSVSTSVFSTSQWRGVWLQNHCLSYFRSQAHREQPELTFEYQFITKQTFRFTYTWTLSHNFASESTHFCRYRNACIHPPTHTHSFPLWFYFLSRFNKFLCFILCLLLKFYHMFHVVTVVTLVLTPGCRITGCTGYRLYLFPMLSIQGKNDWDKILLMIFLLNDCLKVKWNILLLIFKSTLYQHPKYVL